MAANTSRSERAQRIWEGRLEPEVAPKSDARDNSELVRYFFDEVWNKGNLAVVDELIAANSIDYNRQLGAVRGRNGYKATVLMFRTAFPDIHYSLDQVFTEGDRVAIRFSGTGTQRGPFMGIPQTGKQITFGGMTFLKVEKGQFVERWGIFDMAGLLGQLGVGPGQPVPAGMARQKSRYEQVTIIQPEESKSTTRGLGVTNLCKATKDDTRGIFSLFVSSVPAGEGVPIHTHHKEDEAYYILEGEFEMYDTTNNHTAKIGPETYVYVPMGINHGFKSLGDKPGRMVLLITPGGLEGFFEGIGQVIDDPDNPPPPLSGPPDFVRAAQIAAQYNITFDVPEL
jgi:steroid delta-isomerase-like uncharacterized protein